MIAIEKIIQSRTSSALVMTDKVAVFVPSKDANGNFVSVDKRVEVLGMVQKFMSERFGGFTMVESVGGWVEGSATVVEKVDLVISYTNELNNNIIDELIDVAENIKHKLNQSAVSIIINDRFVII